MPFAVAAAGIGAAATVYSASQSSKAAKSANQTQQSAQNALAADMAPYKQVGEGALHRAGDLSGANGPEAAAASLLDFKASPGYQYQFDQGMRAVNAGASANGLMGSGAQLKALQDRGNSLAAQDFAAYYNRLSSLAGLGENAAAGVGNSGVQTAAGQAQTDVSNASNQASMYNQGAQGIGNAINQYGNNSMYEQRTNQLMQNQYNSNGGGYFGTAGGNGGYGSGGYTGAGPFI